MRDLVLVMMRLVRVRVRMARGAGQSENPKFFTHFTHRSAFPRASGVRVCATTDSCSSGRTAVNRTGGAASSFVTDTSGAARPPAKAGKNSSASLCRYLARDGL